MLRNYLYNSHHHHHHHQDNDIFGKISCCIGINTHKNFLNKNKSNDELKATLFQHKAIISLVEKSFILLYSNLNLLYDIYDLKKVKNNPNNMFYCLGEKQ